MKRVVRVNFYNLIKEERREAVMISRNDWLSPTERRMKVLSVICKKRHIVVADLAKEFGVSSRTIRRDIKDLSLSYPLESISGKYGGGVKVNDNFHWNKTYLNTEQIDLLEELSRHLPTREVVIIESILDEFALCR